MKDMKKQIERKLGSTIEEYFEAERKLEQYFRENNMEVERITPLSKLSYEELDYVEAYIKNNVA